MTVDNTENTKIVKKKKAKSQVGTTTANDNAAAKKKKKKSRVETTTVNDNDVPKKKKARDPAGVTREKNNDITKKKKKAKGGARTPTGNDSSSPKKKKGENQNGTVKENTTTVKKSTKSRGVNATGKHTVTKKKKTKSSAEKATGKSSDNSRLPHYAHQSSTPQDRSVPIKISSEVGGDRENKRSRRKSILCISIPVILLLLCLVAGVVLWQLGIFPQKDQSKAISKTTARMVLLEVTERKLTPLEINQNNAFDSGGAEEQALPGKRYY